MTTADHETNELLGRIADALERMAPPKAAAADLAVADAFVWHAEGEYLDPIHKVSRIPLRLLLSRQ